MALTEEQIKSLKKGDPVIIHGTFVRKCADGDILCMVAQWHGGEDFGISGDSPVYARPRCVSLPTDSQSSTVNSQSKYDPCRLFRIGDIVKRRTVDGRTDPDVPEGIDLTVTTGEAKYGNVRVQEPNGRSIVTKAVFLELVTPVEELEPYILEEETAFADDEPCGIIHIYYNYNGGRDKVRTFYENGPESWNATKAAAEAECKRLNEEHRKEQNNA